MINNIMIAVTAVTLAASVCLGYFTLTRLKNSKREFFVLANFCIVIFELGYLSELCASTVDGGLLATSIMYTGGAFIAPLCLVFVQKYCEWMLHYLINIFIFACGISIVLLVWTSEYHNLYYTSYWYDNISPVHHLGVTYGILYPLGYIYAICCTILSIIILLRKFSAFDRNKRIRMVFISFEIVAPITAFALYFFNINLKGANFTPIFIMASMALLYFGLIKYDLLENEETIRAQNWLKDMIGNISHDLKTPLTVLGQYLEILDDPSMVLNEEERSNYIRVAYRKNEELQRMISNLFEITRMESGQSTCRPEWQPVAWLAAELENKYQNYIESLGIAFSVEYTEPFDIRLDHDKMVSVFDNIIYNAVRHTTTGSITVSLSCGAEGMGTIRIADTGEGIAAEHLPHLFERFYKVEAARSGSSGDGGIGLYITKSNILCMGGDITVCSQLNGGTVFTIFLPAEIK